MNVELQINNSTNPNAQFVSWAPSPCRIRVTNPAGTAGPNASVKLSSTSATNGGSVGFRSGTTGAFAPTLTLTLPVNGTSVSFFTAGKFGQPSTNEGDVRIEARVGNTMVGAAKVMVRIRKNANALMPGERDRFVAAFAKLNNQGLGRYVDFRNMHIGAGLQQAPFRALLDLLALDTCWVKVCGSERVSTAGPPFHDAIPFAQALIAAAPDRVLWGTDWPHPNVGRHLPDDAALVGLLPLMAPDETLRQKLLVDNPASLYDFET